MERIEESTETPELKVDLSSIRDKIPSEFNDPAGYRQFMARLSFVFRSNEFSDIERKAFVLHLNRSTTPDCGSYKFPADVLAIFFIFSKTGHFKSEIRSLLEDDVEKVKLASASL